MKKRSTSQSTAFNLRVFVEPLIALTGGLLALLEFGALSAQAQQNSNITPRSTNPLVPLFVDCSEIRELGIDKQENLRAGAIMIFCGETFTQGNPDNPLEIVVAYNDSRGINANPPTGAGASVSTDGGNTFTRLTKANGQSPFDNSGSPVVLYNKPSGTWFTVWLDTGCGGLGGYKSTNPSDPDSWTHYCVHTGSDDRQSGWADNNPSSAFFGRMYVSWNDFDQPNANIFVTFSSDGGTTWHSPVMVSTQSIFIRNVQITGDLATGDVYIAGMDEGGGGFPHNNTNYIFKSTDGGNTWTDTYTGPQFPGPGVTAVGYFACMFLDGGGYWRYEGWGEPAAFNSVVHLVYAQRGTGSDPQVEH